MRVTKAISKAHSQLTKKIAEYNSIPHEPQGGLPVVLTIMELGLDKDIWNVSCIILVHEGYLLMLNDERKLAIKAKNVTVSPTQVFSRFSSPKFLLLDLAQIHALYAADRSSAAVHLSSVC